MMVLLGGCSVTASYRWRAPDTPGLALVSVSTAERRSSERTPRAVEDSSLCEEVKVKP
jgi:hypothetical protein